MKKLLMLMAALAFAALPAHAIVLDNLVVPPNQIGADGEVNTLSLGTTLTINAFNPNATGASSVP